MKTLTRAAAALALVVPLGVATAAPASAAAPGATCIQAGISTLKSLDLLQAAAKQQIDYSTLADPVAGPIFTDLPAGSNFTLGEVIQLHRTSPQLFAWCR